MPEDLRSIVYVSTATMGMESSALEALLVEARDLNKRDGITGVLLLSSGSFMQCIEGRGAGFEETWSRIRNSRRHTGIFTLIDDVVPARSFGDWQMGFFGPTESPALADSTVRWRLDMLAQHRCHSEGRALLEQFWRNAR